MTMLYYWVVLYQATIREVINGAGMILFLTLSIMILTFLWDTWVENSSATIFIKRRQGMNPPVRDWRTVPGVPTACALWWVFAAETYRTGAIWYLYNVGRHLHTSPYPTATAPGIGVFGEAGFGTSFGYLVAGIAMICGLQRCIYIFTPPEWKKRVWVYASIGAVVFCLLPSLANLIGNFYNGI